MKVSLSSEPKWGKYSSSDKVRLLLCSLPVFRGGLLCPQVLLHLEGGKTKMVPDTDRAAAIAYINANPIVFGH